jgi:hypothetical protein
MKPMRRRSVFVLLLAWLAVGCAGVQARSDFDPNARFDSYRTFAFLGKEPGTLPEGAGSEGADPLLARRIHEAIESHLEARGYRNVDDAATADFALSFSLGSREKIQVHSSPTLVGGGYWAWGGWYAGTSVSATSYTEDTLAIDVFDGGSHLAVWHGWASRRISQTSDRAAVVDEVVNAILARFPPGR